MQQIQPDAATRPDPDPGLRPAGKWVVRRCGWAQRGGGRWGDHDGGHDTEALLRRLPLTAGVDPAALTGVYAGLAGFFTDGARRPPPPGIPTVRAFQQAQADALLPWLAQSIA